MFLSEILTEGLIAIPPKMREEMEFYLIFYMLWWARDRFKGKTKELPEQFNAFKLLVKKYGIDIPKETFKPSNQISVNIIPVTLDGMPSNYQHLKPNSESIRFFIQWDRTDQLGGWLPSSKALGVFPKAIEYIAKYPSHSSHPDDLEVGLNAMKETLRHELRHMVQYVILHQHPSQSKSKKNYKDHGKDYYTSPVEFDPTIGSAVQHFLQLWDIYSKVKLDKKKTIVDAALQFIGAKPTNSQFDLFAFNKFFKILKKESPVRYKLAVKKFLQEVRRSTKETIDESINSIDYNYYQNRGKIPSFLEGLVSEAKKSTSFNEFEKNFIVQIKHGIYWHLTDNPHFMIDPENGPRDMSSMSSGKPNIGKLMVTSDINYWSDYYGKERLYAALIDMSNVPSKSYYQVNRGFGNEFFVEDPSQAKVLKVVSLKAAKDADRRWRKYLPQSTEELEAFYWLAISTKSVDESYFRGKIVS